MDVAEAGVLPNISAVAFTAFTLGNTMTTAENRIVCLLELSFGSLPCVGH